jgi:VWFA-related protein
MLRLIGALLLSVACAAAHQPGQGSAITVEVDLVNVYFTVSNDKGRLIPDLDRDSFAVFEDGAAQSVTNFSREAGGPLRIVLLIDTSGSVWDKLSFSKKTAVEFLRATLQSGRDQASVFSFDYDVDLRQDFTNDASLLEAAVMKLYAGGGTRMHDALYFVINEKFRGVDGRKVIVLITDGADQSSRRSSMDVVRLAQRNDVSIYSISVNGLGFRAQGRASDGSDRILETLAAETGGAAFFPTKLKKLGSSFKRIADELRSQYTIAYRSSNAKRDGSFRKIRIDVKDGRYNTRARSGYYAPADDVVEK